MILQTMEGQIFQHIQILIIMQTQLQTQLNMEKASQDCIQRLQGGIK